MLQPCYSLIRQEASKHKKRFPKFHLAPFLWATQVDTFLGSWPHGESCHLQHSPSSHLASRSLGHGVPDPSGHGGPLPTALTLRKKVAGLVWGENKSKSLDQQDLKIQEHQTKATFCFFAQVPKLGLHLILRLRTV